MKNVVATTMAVLAILFGGNAVGAVQDDGLVAYYPFNGNADDESGNGNDGAVYGAGLTQDRFGTPDSAYLFDGVDDYIEILDSTSLKPDQYTVLAWVKMDAQQSDWDHGNWVVTKEYSYQGYGLAIGNAEPGAYISDGSIWNRVESDIDISLNQWHLVCATYDGTTIRLYVDDQLTASADYSLVHTDSKLLIGSWYGSRYFSGAIDDVRIYDRALSVAEIQEMFDGTGQTPATQTWYADFDGDGYGDPNDYITAENEPFGYVSDDTDCDDTDPDINPGMTEIEGDAVDQDCDGSDQPASAGVEQIVPLSPSDSKTIGYGASGGKVTFSFSKISGSAKYILYLNLHDILLDVSFPIPVELIPPGTSNGGVWDGDSTGASTPGFSEEFIGMFYDLTLDSTTWDVLAQYNIQWGVEAYDDSGILLGSTFTGNSASKYVNELKFIASNAVTMTSPANGATLDQADTAPVFMWDTYQGVQTYSLILAHVGSLGFDSVIVQDALTLNLFPMDTPTWQTMPGGTWYWTVLGHDANGEQSPGDFTIFNFDVQ